MKRETILHTQLKKVGDKLIYAKAADDLLYKKFVESLEENQEVDVFFEGIVDSGTLAQLAKIHKCVREIAKETGNDFEDIKDIIKMRAGFCFEKEVDGKVITKCKSFAKASKEDLGFVIEALIKLGDLVGVNCR